MNGHFAIAIDGPSGAGKSSLAKRLASEFGFIYVDTGAIYRTVGLAAIRRGINGKCIDEVAPMLPTLNIGMGYNAAGEQRMLLDGEDVSAAIRQPECSIAASDVSAHPEVRAFLMEMQRKLARENNVIMDGRDIGTAVLPEAELKIFLTASAEERARRRWKEEQANGIDSSYESVLEDMRYRDEQDSTRAAAPLKKAEDAVLVDTTELDIDQSFAFLCAVVIGRLTPALGGIDLA